MNQILLHVGSKNLQICELIQPGMISQRSGLLCGEVWHSVVSQLLKPDRHFRPSFFMDRRVGTITCYIYQKSLRFKLKYTTFIPHLPFKRINHLGLFFFFSVRDFSLQFFPTSSFTVRQDHTAKEKRGGGAKDRVFISS